MNHPWPPHLWTHKSTHIPLGQCLYLKWHPIPYVPDSLLYYPLHSPVVLPCPLLCFLLFLDEDRLCLNMRLTGVVALLDLRDVIGLAVVSAGLDRLLVRIPEDFSPNRLLLLFLWRGNNLEIFWLLTLPPSLSGLPTWTSAKLTALGSVLLSSFSSFSGTLVLRINVVLFWNIVSIHNMYLVCQSNQKTFSQLNRHRLPLPQIEYAFQ